MVEVRAGIFLTREANELSRVPFIFLPVFPASVEEKLILSCHLLLFRNVTLVFTETLSDLLQLD